MTRIIFPPQFWDQSDDDDDMAIEPAGSIEESGVNR